MAMRTPIFVIGALLGLFAASTAEAHASLSRSEPSVGSTVKTAPREVSLWFTETLEPAFSTVEVRDADGAKVDQGKAQTSATVMRIDLKPLPPGTYKVHWRASTVDTHTTEGSFSFHVGQP
jgi:methionine-rich copper-binding protein CopC